MHLTPVMTQAPRRLLHPRQRVVRARTPLLHHRAPRLEQVASLDAGPILCLYHHAPKSVERSRMLPARRRVSHLDRVAAVAHPTRVHQTGPTRPQQLLTHMLNLCLLRRCRRRPGHIPPPRHLGHCHCQQRVPIRLILAPRTLPCAPGDIRTYVVRLQISPPHDPFHENHRVPAHHRMHELVRRRRSIQPPNNILDGFQKPPHIPAPVMFIVRRDL
mmetsp:Transcript_12676/g.36285  ORF Transcript_12676/g.36285 Transcript_12676/m.36285 type:complete len:216 (+) Transcript_12676:1355-2002(+)